jgi:hypothetical protein
MDRPCSSSWTGAHENFRAEEYDAGASLTHQVSQRMEQEEQLDNANTHILKYFGKFLRLPLNEGIHKECTMYIVNGP